MGLCPKKGEGEYYWFNETHGMDGMVLAFRWLYGFSWGDWFNWLAS